MHNRIDKHHKQDLRGHATHQQCEDKAEKRRLRSRRAKGLPSGRKGGRDEAGVTWVVLGASREKARRWGRVEQTDVRGIAGQDGRERRQCEGESNNAGVGETGRAGRWRI
jgi:hypothetical protein